MLESKIQAKLIKLYERQGFYVIKVIRANKNGIPDLLLIKDGIASWVEVKGPRGVISPMQELRAEQLRKAGCEVKFVNQDEEMTFPADEGSDSEKYVSQLFIDQELDAIS